MTTTLTPQIHRAIFALRDGEARVSDLLTGSLFEGEAAIRRRRDQAGA
jgi:hypothetical protein